MGRQLGELCLGTFSDTYRYFSAEDHTLGGSSHCGAHDRACEKSVLNQRADINTKHLLKELEIDDGRHRAMLKMLARRTNLRSISVSFEEMLTGPFKQRLPIWQKAMELIWPMGSPQVTVTDIQKVLHTSAATSKVQQKDKVKNYKEVVAALKGTKYERLLH